MGLSPNLIDLYERYREDPVFEPLRRPGVVLVGGEGNCEDPDIFLVGEAPGATENLEGRPFVGTSGQALRSLLRDVAGIEPSSVWITNVVKYQPLANRTPFPIEIEYSKPYLREEWVAVGKPHVLIAAGGVALAALRPPGKGLTVTKDAGKPVALGDPLVNATTLWPMFHPAAPLYRRELREEVEKHWEAFGDWYRRSLL